MSGTTVKDVFNNFSKDGGIDGRQFSKMCKDAKLFDAPGTLTSTDADLIFAKVKERGTRKLNFAGFTRGLDLIAAKKQIDRPTLDAIILSTGGPSYVGTRALPTKFHDDKTLYTGVHAKGGPTTVDTGRTGFSDLSEIADRSTSTIRGVNTAVAHETVAAPKKK
eukprot:Lankesteria_metandrocarpae@DN5314_c1_g1_i1.p2